MGKKHKNNKHNTTNREETKNFTGPFEFYTDMFTFRQKPIHPTALEGLGLELMNWAQNDPTAFRIKDFFRMKGIHYRQVGLWREKNSKLDQACEVALDALASRREIGAIEGKYDSKTILHMMPHYDPDWKAIEEWRASLRKTEEKVDNGPKIVVLERFPE